MKNLYESILSSTGTGRIAYKKQIENCGFTPELVKMLDNEVAYYKPHSDGEFRKLIREYIRFAGNNCKLNWINTSEITDMKYIFRLSNFNGDISKWDVSNVRDMYGMFLKSGFNGDISKWDVSNVIDMHGMFQDARSFNQDISKWEVKNVRDHIKTFTNCPIKPEYKPKFN